jgi:hypothetical protein
VFLQIESTFRLEIPSLWEIWGPYLIRPGVIHTEDTWFPLICDQGSFENLEAIRNAGVKVLYICQYIVLAEVDDFRVGS